MLKAIPDCALLKLVFELMVAVDVMKNYDLVKSYSPVDVVNASPVDVMNNSPVDHHITQLRSC
jgi:hypothetical protein